MAPVERLSVRHTTPSPDLPHTRPVANDLHPTLLLLDAVIALTAYRRELQRAGYPFKEPPKVEATIRTIEEFCAPPDIRTVSGKK